MCVIVDIILFVDYGRLYFGWLPIFPILLLVSLVTYTETYLRQSYLF